MKNNRLNRKQQGQALIELMVLFPILLIFVATALPMISLGKVAPWLDERLVLKHFLHSDEHMHPLLSQTHEKELLPPYFAKKALRETTQNTRKSRASSIALLPYPGEMIRKVTTLTMHEDHHWNEIILGKIRRDQFHETSRSLTMVTVPDLAESEVVENIKQMSIVGSISPITAVLGKTGLKLYHINLNALPGSGQEER